MGLVTSDDRASLADDGAPRLVAASIDVALAPTTRIAFGAGQGLDSIAPSPTSRSARFLLDTGAQAKGFTSYGETSASIVHEIGGVAFEAGVETGTVARPLDPWGADDRDDYRRFRVAASGDLGPITYGAGLTRLDEESSILGGSLAFANEGATSHFLDLDAAIEHGPWSLAANWQRGQSRMSGGGMITRTRLATERWSLALANGPLSLRVSQPLRVASGGLFVEAPVGFDYATLTANLGTRLVSLAPEGREIDVEAAYGTRIGAGRLDANLYWRREPGHIAAMPDDRGLALRYRSAF